MAGRASCRTCSGGSRCSRPASWPSPTAPTTPRRRWASSRSPCTAPGSSPTIEVPTWVIIVSATAISLGTAIGGWRIMQTMGHRVTELEPIHGFAAETTAATIIYIGRPLRMPVSTTHVISSAIMGVGTSRGLRGVKLGRRAPDPRRLGPDHPRRRHRRWPDLVRPQRARCPLSAHPQPGGHRWSA